MAAIEYGSYYWCVVLNGKELNVPGESIHLHADELAMDPTGALIFKSAGRRPAGSQPGQKDDKDGDKNSNNADKGNKAEGDNKEGSMIYMAFGPGTWRVVYAAKLQDGSPALVEHWNAANGSPDLSAVVPSDSGAKGYTPAAVASTPK
jgi:hypothetical protein